MSAALKLAPPPEQREIVREPDVEGVMRIKSARELAGQKFIEIGQKILSGELSGGRCEWRAASWLESEKGIDTKICFVTLTPQSDEDWTKGRVQLSLFTLHEED